MKNAIPFLIFFFFVSMVQSQEICTDRIEAVNSDNPGFNITLLTPKMWDPGETITVSFMNGDQFLQDKVIEFASEWEEHANIDFDFIGNGNGGMIRVGFQFNGNNGSWSYLGRDALNIPSNEPTMNFGWFNSNTSDTEFSRVILHEFGHVLGCIHEHQHPQANICWDSSAVYSYYSTNLGWSTDQIDRNIFDRYSINHTQFNDYDPNSIMHYAIPGSLLLDPSKAVEWNTSLSQHDIDFIGHIYPNLGVITNFQFNFFSNNNGWDNMQHVRTLADVNGDGKDDIVGFFDDGVYVSISNGTSFQDPVQIIDDFFGNDNGWNNSDHVRTLGDVNNDGKQDIVGFFDDGVYVSISNGTSFQDPIKLIDNSFGNDSGWFVSTHVRTTADINGDGRDDVVGFFDDGVYASISNGGSFQDPVLIMDNFFGNNSGWNNSDYERTLADINGDGKDDIVGFFMDGVYVAISNGTSFQDPVKVLNNSFGQNNGWDGINHVRTPARINQDGNYDIVGFHESSVYGSRSNGGSFANPFVFVRFSFTSYNDWDAQLHDRVIGDVDGDGDDDIVGFHGFETFLYLNNIQPFGQGTTTTNDIENQLLPLKVFPNPTTDLLRIDTEIGKIEYVEIFSIQGKQISFPRNDNQIDTSEFPSGLYIIKVQSGRKIFSSKFMKI
jgi:hypothetical protein